MTDRFEQPERATPSDPRRVFIPAPADGGAPGGNGAGAGAPPRPRPAAGPGADAPPRPGAYRSPQPGARPPAQRSRAIPPGSPPPRRDPFAPEGGRNRGGGPGDGGPGGPTTEGRGFRVPRLKLRRVLLVVAILLVVCLLGGFLWARSIFNSIERVETDGELSSPSSGTNYLIVGSDSREAVDGTASGINDGDFPGGQRADTMLVLHVEGGETKMMSIPRDLYVTMADTGDQGKINGAFNGGAPRLLRTIKDNLDLPIDRYVEVDFVSFGGLVDALGGVTIDFPHPAYDQTTGLLVEQAGPNELTGDEALAYVRSRHYVEVIDGVDTPDGTGDLGRMVRQQRFLTAVFGKLSDTKNPISLLRAFDKTSEGLRIDDDMGLFDALRLGWTLRGGLDPEPLELTFTEDRNDSGAVLILNEEASKPVLDQFH